MSTDNRSSDTPHPAIPLPPKTAANPFAGVSDETFADLVREAKERGITVEQAYQEELEAQRRLAETTPSIEEALRISRLGGAPEYMKNI